MIFFFSDRSIRVKAVHTELHRSRDPQFFLVRGVVKRTAEQPNALTGCSRGSRRASTSWLRLMFSGRDRGQGCIVLNISVFSPRHGTPGIELGDCGPEMIANMHRKTPCLLIN
jgi:hypothetical protein